MEAGISDPLSYEGPFADELRIVADIVQRAGAIPLRYHRTNIAVERKEGDEPVTLADRECSDFLVEHITAAFPDDIVISEEAPDDLRRLDAKRVWYIDPIDGTKSFIAGGMGYCVMVGRRASAGGWSALSAQSRHLALCGQRRRRVGAAHSRRAKAPALLGYD